MLQFALVIVHKALWTKKSQTKLMNCRIMKKLETIA